MNLLNSLFVKSLIVVFLLFSVVSSETCKSGVYNYDNCNTIRTFQGYAMNPKSALCTVIVMADPMCKATQPALAAALSKCLEKTGRECSSVNDDCVGTLCMPRRNALGGYCNSFFGCVKGTGCDVINKRCVKPTYDSCTESKQCNMGLGEKCLNNQCTRPCTSASSCPISLVAQKCINGACACTAHSQCPSSRPICSSGRCINSY